MTRDPCVCVAFGIVLAPIVGVLLLAFIVIIAVIVIIAASP